MISGKNRAKLISVSGSVEFSVVLEERPSYTADVTEYPIEGGQQYSDHVSNRPKSVSIEGIVTGQDASTKLDNIRFWQEKRLSVTYSGRGTYRNFIIKEFRVVEDVSIGDGFRFSLVLQEIKIAIVKTISVKPDPVLEKIVSKTVPAQTQTQVAPISNRGREQPQSALSGIQVSAFYSISILKSILNPWSR